MSLISEFRQAIKKAVDDYITEQKTVLKKLPAHRKGVCLNIYHYIANSNITWRPLKELIKDDIQNLETGLSFFATGHSTLKDNINKVLKNPKYSDAAFLNEELTKIKQQLKQYQFLEPQLLELNNLKQQNAQLQQENMQLKQQYQLIANIVNKKNPAYVDAIDNTNRISPIKGNNP